MKILIVIFGLMVAALTWWVIFFLMSLAMYIAQEVNHEAKKFKKSIKRTLWDIQWALKH
jgi:hypothetical protein